MNKLCLLKIHRLMPSFLALMLFLPSVGRSQENSDNFSWLKLIPPGYWLDSWGFDGTNWDSDFGFSPLSFTNIVQVPDWDGEALQLDSTNAGWLTYSITEDAPGYGVYTNLTLDRGTIEFLFIANWESADTNFNGAGPGDFGRFIDIGSQTTNAAGDSWSLFLNPGGTGICFSSGTNGVRTNYLSAPISWNRSTWHMLALTYSPTNTALYIDGKLVASGDGVRYVPSGDALTNGFAIGSDFATGMQQAHGQFDDLVAYNYQLRVGEIAADYAETQPELPGTHPMYSGPPLPPGGGSGSGGGNTNFVSPTNGLWLWITNIANGTVYADLNKATDCVYEIFSTTNLATATPLPNWNIETEVFPGTNTSVMPFAVPMNGRDALFLSARDWTGITSNGNTVPEWWFYYWYGTINLRDLDLDSIGNTLLNDYRSWLDPLSPTNSGYKPPQYIRPPYSYWNVTDISDPGQPVNIGELEAPFSETGYDNGDFYGNGIVPLNTLWHTNTTIAVTNAYGTTEFGGASSLGTVFQISLAGAGITNIHSFNGYDGAYPCSQLAISGSTYYGISNTLYGTTSGGGINGFGTVFKLNVDGSGFADLYNFTGANDGKFPQTGLLIDGDTLYGTTSNSIFKIKTEGGDFTCLTNNFRGASQLILSLSGDTLYGTTYSGGTSNEGILFSIRTDGSSFTNLHNFTGRTNGAFPLSGLELYGVGDFFNNGPTNFTLLGTTSRGGSNEGSNGFGMVFCINTDGSGFADLHDFESNSDGAYPVGSLLITNNNVAGDSASSWPTCLYGTTSSGGANGGGTLFCITNLDDSNFQSLGTNFQTLCSFASGSKPEGKLESIGSTVYGTTSGSSGHGNGAVFSVNNDGTGFSQLYEFSGGSDGGTPSAGLALPVVDNWSSIWSLDTTINLSSNNAANVIYSIAMDNYYVLYVNGNFVSWTNFNSGAVWSQYSLLPFLHPGQNDVRVIIGGDNDFADYFAMIIKSLPVNTVFTNMFGTTFNGGDGNGTLFEITPEGYETNLYSFSGGPGDGANPIGDLVLSSNTLYGVTENGGTGYGTIFSYTIGDTTDAVLHTFGGVPDGAVPAAGLILVNGTLYGTTERGGFSTNGNGANNQGTIFSIGTDGLGYTNLYSFSGGDNDGAFPQGSLVLVGNALYGTAEGGGGGNGTIFSIDTNGVGYMNLYNFAYTNGVEPKSGLIDSSNILYGTTSSGGSGNNANGTLFSFSIGAGTVQALHTFTNSPDGEIPQGGLSLSGGTLFGTTYGGGTYGYGTLFSIGTNGNGYAIIQNFGDIDSGYGENPKADLLGVSNVLYGTTYYGGGDHAGMIFSISTHGTNFNDVYDFIGSPAGDGANPWGGICFP